MKANNFENNFVTLQQNKKAKEYVHIQRHR